MPELVTLGSLTTRRSPTLAPPFAASPGPTPSCEADPFGRDERPPAPPKRDPIAAPGPTGRRLILVSIDWRRPKDPRTSLGHASLLAALAVWGKQEVVSVTRSVNDPTFDRQDVLDTVLASGRQDDDVGVGVYIWNEAIVQWLLTELRRAGHQGRIILGGPQISYAPPGVLDHYPMADVAIRGFAEEALPLVLQAAGPENIAGVVRKGGHDDGSSTTTDLERLPSPILTGTVPVQPFMRWETQRGCRYACSFCQHRESGRGRRERALSNQRVTPEVDALVSQGARDIAVLDPIFHTNADAVAILHRFRDRGYTGRLSLQSRFELIDDAFLDACNGLNVRLEFGLQTIHRSEWLAIRRPNDLNKADAVIHDLRRRGMDFDVSLIYALPEQSLSSFEESVAWCRSRGVPVIRAFPLMILRGTPLEADRHKWGLIESNDAIPVVVESRTASAADVARMRELADQLDRLNPNLHQGVRP